MVTKAVNFFVLVVEEFYSSKLIVEITVDGFTYMHIESGSISFICFIV